MLTSTILNSKKAFPVWIKSNPNIHSLKEINKVFPQIGLSNFKEDINIKFNLSDIEPDKILHLAIRKYISEFKDNYLISDLKGFELAKMSQILYILEEISRRINHKNAIEIKNNTLILAQPIKSYDNKIAFKRGANCYKIVKTLFELSSKYINAPELVSINNISNEFKNLKLIFSSSDELGAWDIATMSMRGIKSCMRWEAPQSRALIGSVTDPCCGVMYITNEKRTNYGSKMLFRALIRLVHDKISGEPALIVDRLYSAFYKANYNDPSKFDRQIRNLFIKSLKNKLPNIKIIDVVEEANIIQNYALFAPPNFSQITIDERTYLDTKMSYSTSFSDFEKSDIYKKITTKNNSIKNKKINTIRIVNQKTKSKLSNRSKKSK